MMKKRTVPVRVFVMLFLCASCCACLCAQEHRDYLSAALRTSGFRIHSSLLAQWRTKQKNSYKDHISRLPVDIRKQLIAKADAALTYEWPSLPATLFLEFKESGNRVRYERRQNERRERLNQLAIGLLVSGDKKYLPSLANGLWTTLEESTWEIPAIVAIQKMGPELPDPSEQVIGLVGAETAATLAAIQLMLSDQLNEISPVINQRLTYELDQRIFLPYSQRNDYWWMGYTGRPVNNWNVWINTNVLQALLFAAPASVDLQAMLAKIMASTDRFINQYPADGGCEEGPEYWSLAGGKLVSFLGLLKSVSYGRLDFSRNAFLHSIGSYILKMHISRDYFVNFADAAARAIPNPVGVFAFGELYGDDTLKQFAAYLFSMKRKPVGDSNIVDFLSTTVLFRELAATKTTPVLLATGNLPRLEVYTARSIPASENGMFLAVQGGNNGESHNHNDVGNFILYAKGKPVIIDAGVGTYTAQTFSSSRYEIWNMQSQWHNCPTVNGIMQQDGKTFKARGSQMSVDRNQVLISMDIAGAYPATASLQQWKRQFHFDQTGNKMVLSDQYHFTAREGKTTSFLLSACEIRLGKPGEIGFYDTDGSLLLQLEYPARTMQPQVEEKLLDDEKLIAIWGAKIYRLSLLLTDTGLQGSTSLLFTMPQ